MSQGWVGLNRQPIEPPLFPQNSHDGLQTRRTLRFHCLSFEFGGVDASLGDRIWSQQTTAEVVTCIVLQFGQVTATIRVSRHHPADWREGRSNQGLSIGMRIPPLRIP